VARSRRSEVALAGLQDLVGPTINFMPVRATDSESVAVTSSSGQHEVIGSNRAPVAFALVSLAAVAAVQ
jgi:hypothetical protein